MAEQVEHVGHWGGRLGLRRHGRMDSSRRTLALRSRFMKLYQERMGPSTSSALAPRSPSALLRSSARSVVRSDTSERGTLCALCDGRSTAAPGGELSLRVLLCSHMGRSCASDTAVSWGGKQLTRMD